MLRRGILADHQTDFGDAGQHPDVPGPQIDRDGARGGEHRVHDFAAFELAGEALARSGDADRGDDLVGFELLIQTGR